jgi:hypothetical protein
MALLLTNAEGFRAHVALTGGSAGRPGESVAGELMSRRDKLLFAPEPAATGGKRARAEDFSFIWDVSEGRGFMLNGPLQGYAPVAAKTRFTNVVASAARITSPPEKVAGHPCQQAEVKVCSSDGTATVLCVWRATDLKGVPLRITGAPPGTPPALNFSKVRMESPPDDLFLPPDGFTKYASAEAMMTELTMRQQNHKRKPGYEPPPSDEVGARDVHAPNRSP